VYCKKEADMKRQRILIVALVVLCVAAATVSAGEGKEEMEGKQGKKCEMMGHGGMMGEGGVMGRGGMMQTCPMHKMMAPMPEPQIVATRDGGVVVMLAGRLYKYDRNLDLKAETELKIGLGQAQGMMMHMMGKCPMMQGMDMKKEGMGMHMMGKDAMMDEMKTHMKKCPMMKGQEEEAPEE
jgi:hypothetical protein